MRDDVIVMVGGAPVTQEYADAVGADGYAADASGLRAQGQGPAQDQAREGARLMGVELQQTRIRSASREVVIGGMHRFCIIGERINPTGRRIFQEQLKAGDMSAIERDVKAQVAGGADVLDVNMGVPLIDEAELLAKAVTMIQSLTDLPLCIDSSVVEALEAGLSAYDGRALVNSITAEDERMEQILPLVKKYDAAVIALPNDVDEIPMEPDKRLELVEKIVRVATQEYGIALEDIVIDPLAMPIGADAADRSRDARDDATDPRRLRPEHDLWLLQRLLRHARSPRAQRHLPVDGDDRRPDQRDHGRAHAGGGHRPSRRPTCCSGTTSGEWHGSPGTAEAAEGGPGDGRRHVSSRRGEPPRGARHLARPRRRARACWPRPERPIEPHDGTGRVQLSFTVTDGQDRAGAGAAGRERLRLGVVERHRDRLHLRRPRHLPQVQGASRRAHADLAARPAYLLRHRARQRLATGLPGDRRPRTSRSRCRR